MDHETPISPKALESVFGVPVSRAEALASIQNLPEEYEIFKSLSEVDIIVQLEDGSYIDVEMQKTGYYFPGQRSCCYASDMIMRQYSRLKNKLKDNFTYQSMKPVFLIVLMEISSSEFKAVSPSYMHHELHSYDSGAKVRNLANTTYISLDTFRKVVHNIDTKLQAWLTFLSSDSAEDIIKLVTAYPEFKEYYQDIADFRTNPKEWIYMYSKSLAETDRNTERYMVTDMQNTIEKQNAMLAEKDAIILQLKNELSKMQSNTYQENKY